jgi:hypothetical protein
MKWNSVKDKLPPHGRCLIFVPEHIPQVYIDGYGACADGYIGFAHDLMFITKVHSCAEVPEPPAYFDNEGIFNGNN